MYTYYRSIKLPTDADPKSAKCKFEEGVLKVSIPRTEFKKIEEKTLRIE